MINDGRIVFGIYPGAVRYIFGPRPYNDGAWHHVVATLSSAGMTLYVDGLLVASDTRYRDAEPYSGYGQIGAGTLPRWPSPPTSNYFAGTLDETAIYTQALSATQVAAHYNARQEGQDAQRRLPLGSDRTDLIQVGPGCCRSVRARPG
ncbi:LamG domain-containing protein [Arthrobacter sp. Soc17.1.1.1]|uniref:LamG domain-containing protein n=1 Tax=Arthrobacter sp. Soc17.1.1.1 TaxID=3121277 RepID=UPI003FA5CAC4